MIPGIKLNFGQSRSSEGLPATAANTTPSQTHFLAKSDSTRFGADAVTTPITYGQGPNGNGQKSDPDQKGPGQ